MFALALLFACQIQPSSIDEVAVSRAWLEGADFNAGAIIGGVITGDALLVVQDNAGLRWEERVSLRGPVVSLGAESSLDPELGGPIELILPEDQLLTGRALLGMYRGPTEAIALGVGVSARQLKNRHGVALREVHLSIGGGAMVGFEWLRVVPGGREGLVDTSPVESAAWDTSTRDSAAWDSAAWDSAARDSAYSRDSGARSSGCACAGIHIDSDPDSGDSRESPTDSPADSPADSPPDSPADNSEDTGASSSGSCAVRPGAARSGWLVGMLAFVASRRQRAERGPRGSEPVVESGAKR